MLIIFKGGFILAENKDRDAQDVKRETLTTRQGHPD